MQTNFSPELLADSHMRASEKIVRTCVHCGFCTATCPTYLLLGDELDSPRGRIYLIKEMLENRRPATETRGQARRSLPVLPRLHDDLPIRRALHAPRRPRPRLYRGDLPAPARRPPAARRAFPHPPLARPVPRGAAAGRDRAAAAARGRSNSAIWRETRGDAGAGAQVDSRRGARPNAPGSFAPPAARRSAGASRC